MENKMPRKTKKTEQLPQKSDASELPFTPAAKVKKMSIDDIMAGTEAGRIWDDIKNREIFMFALPNQIVSQHAKPVLIDPGILHLVLMSSAALPSLEEAVSKSDPRRGIVGYQVELADRFVVVKPAPLPLTEKKR
jgi:hypothetical protein